jgi:hypothetical protein
LLQARIYAKSAASRASLRTEMADHGEVEYATATGNDYEAHEETYRNFITLTKSVLVTVVVIVVLMAYFLV